MMPVHWLKSVLAFPSVLRHCRLGDGKDICPVRKLSHDVFGDRSLSVKSESRFAGKFMTVKQPVSYAYHIYAWQLI